MAKNITHLDWSHVQTLLAVVETGSLSSAARALNLTQPTIGRHIARLEETLGMSLFQRQARGMAPTTNALELIEPARSMQEQAKRLELSASGLNAMSGSVRITSSVFVAHYVLPSIIAEVRLKMPEIFIELLPSDTTENLLFREADIAVRMFQPTQLDLVARHIGNLELGLFAAKSYLERKSPPKTVDDLREHDFVG